MQETKAFESALRYHSCCPARRRSHLMPGLPDFYKPVLTKRRDNGCQPSAFTRAPKGLSGGSSEVIVPPALIALPRTNRQFSERSAQGTFPLHCFCVLNCRCDHYSTVCAVVKRFSLHYFEQILSFPFEFIRAFRTLQPEFFLLQ